MNKAPQLSTAKLSALEEALEFERIASLKVLKLDEDLRLANEEIIRLRAAILTAVPKLKAIAGAEILDIQISLGPKQYIDHGDD